MGSFFIGRLAQTFVALLVIATLVFVLIRIAGDPTDALLPLDATFEDRERLRIELGLDKPIYHQYFIFLSDIARGDFGISTRQRRSALKSVLEIFPNTLKLAGLSMAVLLLIAVPTGIYSALHRGSVSDWLFRFVALLGNSFPSFWLGVVLMILFAVWLQWLPPGGTGTPAHYVLPVLTLSWYLAGGLMRLVRSSMLEVLGKDYIRTANAKGLSQSTVTWRHAFRNALLPIVTYAGVIFLRIIAGTVIVETVFAWPGIGRAVITSINWRDYPMVQTIVMILGAIFLFGNLLVDMAYYYIDPRLRHVK